MFSQKNAESQDLQNDEMLILSSSSIPFIDMTFHAADESFSYKQKHIDSPAHTLLRLVSPSWPPPFTNWTLFLMKSVAHS